MYASTLGRSLILVDAAAVVVRFLVSFLFRFADWTAVLDSSGAHIFSHSIAIYKLFPFYSDEDDAFICYSMLPTFAFLLPSLILNRNCAHTNINIVLQPAATTCYYSFHCFSSGIDMSFFFLVPRTNTHTHIRMLRLCEWEMRSCHMWFSRKLPCYLCFFASWLLHTMCVRCTPGLHLCVLNRFYHYSTHWQNSIFTFVFTQNVKHVSNNFSNEYLLLLLLKRSKVGGKRYKRYFAYRATNLHTHTHTCIKEPVQEARTLYIYGHKVGMAFFTSNTQEK